MWKHGQFDQKCHLLTNSELFRNKFYLIFFSGLYSRKAFQRLGFEVKAECIYEDFVTLDGEKIFIDAKEPHRCTTLMTKKIWTEKIETYTGMDELRYKVKLGYVKTIMAFTKQIFFFNIKKMRFLLIKVKTVISLPVPFILHQPSLTLENDSSR